MKTAIITIITLLTITLSVNVSKAAAKNNDGNQIAVLAVNNINKIEASGNVEVYITNGDKDQVKVFDKYYDQNALVQDKDGVLRISSYNTEKLVVLVTVSDLHAITANDNASIKSYGKLSVIDLNLVLNNNASAQLKLDAFAANITLNNRAVANLSGNIIDYSLNYSQSSTLNKTGLTVQSITENNTSKPTIRQVEENVASL